MSEITTGDELTTALRTGIVTTQLFEAGAEAVTTVRLFDGTFTAHVLLRYTVTLDGEGPSVPAALEACYRQVTK